MFFGGAKVIEVALGIGLSRELGLGLCPEPAEDIQAEPGQKSASCHGEWSLWSETLSVWPAGPRLPYLMNRCWDWMCSCERFYRVLVEDYANHPRTILLSTHLIDEIATVVEKVYIMDSGAMLLHDDVDHIRANSHLLTGNQEQVELFTKDRHVTYKESYGKGSLTAIYGAIHEADRAQANKLGIAIDGLPRKVFLLFDRRRSIH